MFKNLENKKKIITIWLTSLISTVLTIFISWMIVNNIMTESFVLLGCLLLVLVVTVTFNILVWRLNNTKREKIFLSCIMPTNLYFIFSCVIGVFLLLY